MQKRCSILIGIIISCVLCYGQEISIDTEKAASLSRMADFYYTAHNYEKAIDMEKKALEMKSMLYGARSLEYAISAFNVAKYYYGRGIELEAEDNSPDFIQATEYANSSMAIIKDTVLSEMEKLDYNARYQFWQNVNTIFDSIFPRYVAKNPTDSTLSNLYNTVLFSKGITWRKYGGTKTTYWKDIQKALCESDIAIEFISPVVPSNDNMVFYALTIKRGYNSPKMIRLFDILQFQEMLNSYSAKVEKDTMIGEMVWTPLSSELVGVKNVYFSATHVLNNMPIEYMPISETENCCDKYNMFRVSSTQEIVKRKAHNQYRNAVLYGGLRYEPEDGNDVMGTERSGFEPLPNTGEEVLEIAKVLGDDGITCLTYTGENGTESSFMSLSGTPIDILHLATHGMYVSNSEIGRYHDGDEAQHNSILVLSEANKRQLKGMIDRADGIVTASDLSKMNLDNIDIVTLSACESALGEYGVDDSIMGLQRGFKIAGVNTILMSLDKVDDEATRILMVEFYRNLMSGKTKLQSLKEAQKYLRQVENGRYDNSKYWASFIMLDGLN